jgi:hypothetical protein
MSAICSPVLDEFGRVQEPFNGRFAFWRALFDHVHEIHHGYRAAYLMDRSA